MVNLNTLAGGPAFLRAFKGAVITAASAEYETARKLWNGDIDRRPAAVVKALDDADVTAAILFAREADLPLAVRGGGHSYPGHSVSEGGITIDLSQISRVELDTEARHVRAGGGALLGSVDRATLPHGQVTPAGIVSHTGLGGLGLGGGIGYLTRSFGLTSDQFTRLRLIMAEGETIHASDEENPDLFWALRGGGGNFGVVTEFGFRTHVLGPVQAGPLVYRMSDAADAIEALAGFIKTAPRELSITFALSVDPARFPQVAEHARGERLLTASIVYRGLPEDRVLTDVRRLVTPLWDGVTTKDFGEIQTANDDIAERGVGWYMKSGHARELTRPLIDWLVENATDYRENVASDTVRREVYAIQSIGGAVHDIDEAATAYSGRDAEWHVAVEVGFTTPEDRARIVPWTRESWNKTKSLLDMTTSYVNLNFEEGADALEDVFGAEKYRRLREIKTRYDADNVFRYNSNIPPLQPAAVS